jgi:hypothetical protein
MSVVSFSGASNDSFAANNRRAAAAIGLAALLLFALSGKPAFCDVIVEGFPEWLERVALRSLSAVWDEVAPRQVDKEEKERVLSLVASRLLQGYIVQSVSVRGDEARFVFRAAGVPFPWSVVLTYGNLPPPPAEWLEKDTAAFVPAIESALEGIPLEALSWGDEAFREFVRDLAREALPGWDAVPLVRLRERGAQLQIQLVPRPPLVLALVPRLRSTTLPLMLRKDLHEGLLADLSPLAGLPVPWVKRHREEVEAWAGRVLSERNTVRNSRARVEVTFVPETLAPLDVRVESRKYTISAWAAAYAGTDDRYGEIGLHLGRKAQPWSGWEVELYGEWVAALNDFAVESRWGVRWSPWGETWLGAEMAYPGETLWWRFWVDGAKPGRPYLWWRWSEDYGNNGGLGWRLTEHLSLELHYDERDKDEVSLRAVGNL